MAQSAREGLLLGSDLRVWFGEGGVDWMVGDAVMWTQVEAPCTYHGCAWLTREEPSTGALRWDSCVTS